MGRMLKMSEWLSRPADEAAAETLGGAIKSKIVDLQKNQVIGEYLARGSVGRRRHGARRSRPCITSSQREVAVKLLPRRPCNRPNRSSDSSAKCKPWPGCRIRISWRSTTRARPTERDYFVMDLVVGKRSVPRGA